MIIDIDNFKAINDRFGHDAGDSILKAVSAVCYAAKRESDILARIGGEEFAMLLPETDDGDSLIAAERLLDRVRGCRPVIGPQTVSVTVSIGIASSSSSMFGIATLIKCADDALYDAKHSGRNRVASGIVRDQPSLAV